MSTKIIQLEAQRIPKLRFPEFSDVPSSAKAVAGNWEEKELGGVLKQKIRVVPKPTKSYLAIGIRNHFKGTFQKPDSDPDKISMDKLFVVEKSLKMWDG